MQFAATAMIELPDIGALDFASIVRPGDTLMWGQADAEPLPLTQVLMQQRHSIGGRFRAFVGASLSDAVDVRNTDCIEFCSYCGAGANRALAKAGKLTIWPWHYSQLARQIRDGDCKVDVLLLQLAPPDRDGRYSLGIAYEYLVPAIDRARVVVAEVNEQAPWTYGERYLARSDIDVMLRTSRPPLTTAQASPDDVATSIARRAASLIGDGCTLQIGLGTLPEILLSRLSDRRDLGIHSGTIGDAVADLMEAGVITNARKSVDRGVTVSGTMMGTRRIHAFAQRNALIHFRSTEYTHDAEVLASIDRLVTLNSAIEVDVTGQVNAEVANGVYVGAVGGALDFLRGAQRSRGGLPIIALPSTTRSASRIVSELSGPVTVPRSDAGIFVTEHGIADLRGLSTAQRVDRMIGIAHPDFQAQLSSTAGSRML